MKNGSVKIAVTLPRILWKTVKETSRRRHKSLDILVKESLERCFSYSGKKKAIRQYIKGYRRKPETDGEVRLAERLSLPLLAEESW